MTLSFSVMVAVTADRIARLARPPDDEPAPLQAGTAEQWAALAGVGAEPHPLLVKATPIDPGDHDPAGVAQRALQRLVARDVMEWAGPGLWRPVQRPKR